LTTPIFVLWIFFPLFVAVVNLSLCPTNSGGAVASFVSYSASFNLLR
jgi:hypothetical protein